MQGRAGLTVRGVATQLAIVAAVGAVYLLVLWSVRDRTDEALANAREVLALERALGLDVEEAVQAAAMSVPWWSAFCAQFYVWGYFPVVLTALAWSYVRHRPSYLFLRTAMLCSLALGFLGYALYPCAPPWLLGGFVDTVASGSLGDVARPPGVANVVAAMPSMHVGMLLLVSVVVFATVHSPVVRAWCVLHPVMMAYAVVATGNHWVLDIPAGVAVAVVGLVAAAHVAGGPIRAADRLEDRA